ncbi:MAG: ion channel [Myxococcota bacterium]
MVTMTTLGFGDAIPASTGAQALVIIQVITGYVMLGGLLSLLSNKMARRAE